MMWWLGAVIWMVMMMMGGRWGRTIPPNDGGPDAPPAVRDVGRSMMMMGGRDRSRSGRPHRMMGTMRIGIIVPTADVLVRIIVVVLAVILLLIMMIDVVVVGGGAGGGHMGARVMI